MDRDFEESESSGGPELRRKIFRYPVGLWITMCNDGHRRRKNRDYL
jgi:hypothetical protein